MATNHSQLKSQNGDYDLTSAIEVLTVTPTADSWCYIVILVGDGVKDPAASSGVWE